MNKENSNAICIEINDCLKKLCNKICQNKNVSKAGYRIAVLAISDVVKNKKMCLEDDVHKKIHDHLYKFSSVSQADKFSEYYQQLKMSHMVKNHTAILEFLYNLSTLEQGNSVNMKGFHGEFTKTTNLVSPHMDKYNIRNQYKKVDSSTNDVSSPSQNVPKLHFTNKMYNLDNYSISEREMIQEVLYAAQGVKKYNGYKRSIYGKAGLVLRISELGFLHDKICYYIDPTSGCMPSGLIGEGLRSALRNELTEYYRSLAMLQSQLNSSLSQSEALTLRRLSVWSLEPLQRLKWLSVIGYASQNKKGGELASCVYKFLAHGDPRVTSLVHQLLGTVCYPLYVMLCRWLLDGEIDDPYNEFFIDCRTTVAIDRLWHDKYRVRETMLPAFISKEQAQHILATGKSVTFLREVCGDREQIKERDNLKRILDNSSVELLFSGSSETKLHAVMSAVYLGVSRRLLDTLLNPHKLLKHLQALRGYLLLGQGDFVQLLMVLLEPQLNRNANQLFVHNLTGILDSAVRATNAQYEDQDIINRLYVNLFPPSPQDNGWDVFSLFYRVEGPLGTVLDPEASACYRTLFTHLWRAKRMEHVLAQMWKQHTIEYKTFSKMSEVMPLLRRLHTLRSEMVHLVKELQYALFVVIECAWQNFLTCVNRAVALDQLLVAHRQYLTSVTAGALLDDASKQLQSYLGNVYDEILSLKKFETNLYTRISEEYQRRRDIKKLKEERSKRGDYETNALEDQKNEKALKVFVQYLVEKKADFNVLSRAYRGHVKTFILKLALQNEVSLQSLLFRLDYNDFYKRGDVKLHEPLTYQHKRLSEIGLANKQNGVARKHEQQALEKDRSQNKIRKQK